MKKWIMRLVATFGLLWIAAWIAAGIFVNKESMVRLIEKKIMSRAQLGELDWEFRGFSIKVTAKELILAERDQFANDKVPVGDRPLLTEGEVKLDRLSFDVSLIDLFSNNIEANDLTVDGAMVKMHLYKNGENSLEPLFARPDKKKKEKKKKINAHDHKDWVTVVKSLNLKNLKLILIHEKSKLRLSSEQLYIKLNDIRIDPNQLEEINTARIVLNGALVLGSEDGKTTYARLALDCEGKAKVFRPEDGDLDPDAQLSVQLAGGSYFNSEVPMIDKIYEKAEMLKKVGIKLPKIPEQFELKSDETLSIRYYQHVVTFQGDATLGGDDSFIRLKKDTWIKVTDEMHEAHVHVFLSGKYAQSLTEGWSKDKGGVLGKVSSMLASKSLREKELSMPVRSYGELSDPEIELQGDWKWMNDFSKDKIKDSLKKQAGSLLKELF